MKKLSILLLTIFFIFVFYTACECATWDVTFDEFEYNGSTYFNELSSEAYSTLSQLDEFGDNDYDLFYFCCDTYNVAQFFPKSLNVSAYLTSSINPDYNDFFYFQYDTISTTNGCIYYTINEDTGVLGDTYNNSVYDYYLRYYQYHYYMYNKTALRCYATIPVYTNSNMTTLFFGGTSESLIEPEFLNADTTKYGNTLENGKFNYFYINANDIGSLSFVVTDNTLASNNSTSTFNLNSTSNYCYDTTLLKYAIPKTDLAFQYLSGHDYTFTLNWIEGATPKTLTYNVSTDFSSPTIINGVQNDLYSIDFEVQNISGVLLDYSFNNQIVIGNMPSSSEYTNPAEASINLIFDAFKNVFTSESEGTNVRFYVPYSNNQYIDIPSDLVSSHVPIAIVNLIQMVYWAFISIYIIKDIAKIADKAKSGDILDDKNGNIKTDML